MGDVRRLVPHRNVDGKILLERVDKTTYVSSLTAHQNVTDGMILNQQIKSGEWNSLFTNNSPISVYELLTAVLDMYSLAGSVADRLELSYETYIGATGKKKGIKLEDEVNAFLFENSTNQDKTILAVNMLMTDLRLKVRYIEGNEIELDCFCDSKYMRTVVYRVMKAMREKYYWIEKKIHCI